ncbi:MAG: hypothetical protein ACI4N3_01145 [Alphaproteobacteria bacterium]
MKTSERKAFYERIQDAIDQGNIDFDKECEQFSSRNEDTDASVEEYLKVMNEIYKKS